MREATANGQFAKAMRTFTLTDSNWQKLSIVGGSETDAVAYLGTRAINTDVPRKTVADNIHDVSPHGRAFTSLPPDKLEDWTDYVGTVARHPANYAVPTDSRNQTRRIKYWEIWNETTNSGPVGANYVFYRGTTAQLVELTKQARDVLKDIWTGHQIVAPNSLTLEGLEAFLSSNTAAYGKPKRGGGGQYVDIFSLHAYDHISLPEAQRPYVAAYRDVLGRFPGQTLGKPLWNTEGTDLLPGAAPSDESAGIVSRKFISQWVDGISNFNWYAWDIFWYSDHGLGTDPRATSGNGLQLTVNGVAYRKTYEWMVGATAVSRTITPSGTGGERRVVELKRPGSYRGWIVWDPGAYTPVNRTIPGAFTGVTTLRRLNATSSATSRGATIQIGVSPINGSSSPLPTTARFRAAT